MGGLNGIEHIRDVLTHRYLTNEKPAPGCAVSDWIGVDSILRNDSDDFNEYIFEIKPVGVATRMSTVTVPVFAVAPRGGMVDASVAENFVRVVKCLCADVTCGEQSVPQKISLADAVASVSPELLRLHGAGCLMSELRSLTAGTLGVDVTEEELCEILFA